MKRWLGWVAICVSLAMLLPLAPVVGSDSLEVTERKTKTIGATTITWDSSFQDLDYIIGDTIAMVVSWSVDAGADSN